MAIATALPGFRDLGRLVTPTCLSRNLLSTFSKDEQKINVGNLKNFNISVNGTSNPAILQLQGT